MIDKMVSCIDSRFIDNADMYGYSAAEQLLIDQNPSIKYLLPKCEKIAEIFKDVDSTSLSQELAIINKCRQSGSKDFPAFNNLAELSGFLRSKQQVLGGLFPETLKLANLLTVVPASSATAERSFSCLKRIKTWLRSTMTQTRLNDLALLHAHREMTPDLNLVMKEFICLNDGRRTVFGNPICS
jgi:hypothetical protein